MSFPPSGGYQQLHARSPHRDSEAGHVDDDDVGHPQLGNELAIDGAWKPIPYKKLARWTALAFAAIGAVAAVYGSIIGWKAYRVASLPHKAHSASKADIKAGVEVVQPYFGPTSKGALVEDVDLLATIWFREGVSPPHADQAPEWAQYDPDWEWYRPSHGRNHGFGVYSSVEEYGPMSSDYEYNGTAWEQVLVFPTRLASVSTEKQVTHEVLLPGRIVHSLATNPWSRLVGTFALTASKRAEASATVPDFHYITAKSRELYGDTAVWPLSQRSQKGPAPLDDFLAGSGVGYDLASAYEDPPQWHDLTLMRPEHERNESFFTTMLTGRTWVNFADDFPTYTLKGYNSALEDLRTLKLRCQNLTSGMWWPGMASCDRTFQREGHFENLLKVHAANIKDDHRDTYRYGPFLTTMLTSAAAKEYIRLPKAHTLRNMTASSVADLKYEWHLTYSALSPLKFELARKAIKSAKMDYNRDGWGFERYNPMLPPHVVAATSDRAELLNSLLGHKYNSGSHPILRAFLKAIGSGCRYIANLLLGLYWYTRRVSTGLAIEVLLIETVVTLLVRTVQASINWVDTNVLWFGLICAGLVLVAAKQIFLRSRIQIQLSGFKPTAFRIRGYKGEEWTSYKQRTKMGWKVPAAIAVTAFILLRAELLPPPLVSAQNFEDHELLHWRDDWETTIAYRPWVGILSIHRTMKALGNSTSLVARIEQIRLNHIRGTFAGAYAIGTFFTLLALICSSIPSVFAKWLGRSEYMTPFGAWDVLIIILDGTLLWQARWLPRIAQ